MKKLGLVLALSLGLATSPALALHGGGQGGHFGGGGQFAGRSVARGGFGRGGLGWAVPALGGVIGGYGVSECYQWNGWRWVWVCGYPAW
jgi:hypothetical protein